MKHSFKNIAAIALSILAISCTEQAKYTAVQGKAMRDVLNVVSKYPGRIVELYTEEGVQVTTGDTLALLYMPEVEAKMSQAQGAVDAARAQYEMALKGATDDQLSQVSAKLEAVTEQYRYAEKSYTRINNMFQEKLISEQKHDEVYMKYQNAKSQYEGVLAKYNEVKSGVRNEKIRMALGTYERAKGALQEANVAYSERFLVAPQAMSIETITLQEGELLLPGYSLITGYRQASCFYRFTIPESQIGNYQVGQKLNLSLPFLKEEQTGVIKSVKQLTSYAKISSAYPDYELGQAIYEIKVIPTSKTKKHVPTNMTVLLK